MSYLSAEEVLPKELIETIQQYIEGKTIYIPCKEKKTWGSNTDTKEQIKSRNEKIYADYLSGIPTSIIADNYSLSIKSIQRIIRIYKGSNKDA